MEDAARYVSFRALLGLADHFSEYPRSEQRIIEGEAKRNKRSNLESLLMKIESVRYPMQELELNYPTFAQFILT